MSAQIEEAFNQSVDDQQAPQDESSSSEPTKEIYRRDDVSSGNTSVTQIRARTPPSKIHMRTPQQSPRYKQSMPKPKNASKKQSNSGIPVKLKPTPVVKPAVKPGTYRPVSHHQPLSPAPVINRNTLEMQFMNNKKRLMQLHAEVLEKQRPLLDMHKSLLRTKKQLEHLGKKVALEDLKIISLKVEEAAPKTPTAEELGGAGEICSSEATTNLRTSIDQMFTTCVKVCQKCFVQRDDVVKMLESVSDMEPSEVETEVESLKHEKDNLEKLLNLTIEENEKKVDELLEAWQKSVRSQSTNDELNTKLVQLEETISQQQKTIGEAEDNLHHLTRRFEDKKASYEKQLAESNEQLAKLEEELKKEKKVASENLLKSRNFRSRVLELERLNKEADEKKEEALLKLKQFQEQMRKKEVQWVKEKDDFKKNEALLQQKFAEKQSQFDTRLRELETTKKCAELDKENSCRSMETQLEIKDHELFALEKEKEKLYERSVALEDEVKQLSEQLEEKEKEIEELSLKEPPPALPPFDYVPQDDHVAEITEYKKKIADVQDTLKQQTEQISKMQSSLKAHAQLAVALKLEKDNAIKYSNKLRDILKEARDEIDFKNKTIYKIHEKLVLKEATCDKLKAEMKDFESSQDFYEKLSKNHCQLCMSNVEGCGGGGCATKPSRHHHHHNADCSSCAESDLGKVLNSSNYGGGGGAAGPQYVSESLIGMSVRKVDSLRARLDSLKRKLPADCRRHLVSQLRCAFSNQTCAPRLSPRLRKQIEMRGKLYEILQKHADQSCEDFINLLKLTASGPGQGFNELNPSNCRIGATDSPDVPTRDQSSGVPAALAETLAKSFNSFKQRIVDYDNFDESTVLEDDLDYDYL